MAYPASQYHLFIVTYEKNTERKLVKIRAKDKRRAKTLTRQKFGSDVAIVAAVRWKDYERGKRR
ncbi:MAG: hypothetical protein KDD51_04525 [Bdellovibrionales bacterium]|nr:hypothetical protein [Bdellovibrionales bacterium]